MYKKMIITNFLYLYKKLFKKLLDLHFVLIELRKIYSYLDFIIYMFCDFIDRNGMDMIISNILMINEIIFL